MMDPYRQDKDKGDKSNFQIFSNGPYKLEGAWDKDKGGTLVRNDELRRGDRLDRDPQGAPGHDRLRRSVRPPRPIYDRMIADTGDDQSAVTSQSVPPPYYSRSRARRGPCGARRSPYIYYLVPNFRTRCPTRHPSRRSRSRPNATPRSPPSVATRPTASPSRSSTRRSSATRRTRRSPAADAGDPEAAKPILEDAGVEMPYPIMFTYPSSETNDKAAAALKDTWDAVRLRDDARRSGATPTTTSSRSRTRTATSSGVVGVLTGRPPITVTPPLFDSRPNLTANSNGQDYGAYESDEFNALVDEAAERADLDARPRSPGGRQLLGEDVAYIPLNITKFYFLHGSKVTDYTITPRPTCTRTSVHRCRAVTASTQLTSTVASGGRVARPPDPG